MLNTTNPDTDECVIVHMYDNEKGDKAKLLLR